MDRVHKGVRYTQIMVFVWSAVTMVLVYFFGEEMTLLFVSKTETEVLHAAEVYFRTVFWAYPFLGSIFIYRNALQGMGYGLVPMLGGVFELAARALIVLLVAGKTSLFRCLPCRSGGMDFGIDSIDSVLHLCDEKI